MPKPVSTDDTLERRAHLGAGICVWPRSHTHVSTHVFTHIPKHNDAAKCDGIDVAYIVMAYVVMASCSYGLM